MGTRDQLVKKTSDSAGSNRAETVPVINLQVGSNPANGDTFDLAPYRYRIASAAGNTWNADGSYYVLRGANVSATYSALSASINATSGVPAYQMAADASNVGWTAAGAAGSRTDITLTSKQARNNPPFFRNVIGAALTATESTASIAGKTLPEGFVGYVTSAGNTVRVSDPAEATRAQQLYPTKKV